METRKKQNEKFAMLLSIIPGLGQFYNKQYVKGIALLLLFGLELFEIITFGIPALIGLVTLGSTPMEDHSLFLLIEGAIQIIVIFLMIAFHFLSILDAKHTASQINLGIKVPTTLKDTLQNLYDKGFAYLLIVPSYLAMIFAIVFPVIVTLLIAFTNYDFRHIPPNKLLDWIGFKNFLNIVQLSTFKSAFTSVLSWTFIWTIVASSLQIIIGVLIAIVYNQPNIKFKRIFGVIFLLPWAVPGFVSIMSFSNFFNDSIGAMNMQVLPFIEKILPFIDFGLIPWKTDPFWTKVAIIMIQGWLGFPYIYVLTSGILQSIPQDLYEAATVDGATALQKFNNITLPMILTVAAPTFIS
ncbi:TPA: ABC transporter permease subunit, partial [Streptococcus suis]